MDLKETIATLPVFDTHSHINAPGRQIMAQSFSDLGHYFWLSQQMNSVGWEESKTLDKRAATAYFNAFLKTENTAMNWCLRRILFDIYKITIQSPEDILRADCVIRERASISTHVQEVCRKGNIRQVTQNLETQANFPGSPELGVLIPDTLNGPVASFLQDPSDDAAEQTVAALHKLINAMFRAGHKGARIDFNLFESLVNDRWQNAFLGAIFSGLQQCGMFVQIFIGMKRQPRGSFPQNDPTRITGLIPFFQQYQRCKFELVCAAEGNCLDVVQAAVMNPNVNPGGLWWYTFRPSLYVQTLEQRLEALAPLKCPVLASDATCIEWCYGKAILVKKLVAEVLVGKVEKGWISEECAIRTASEWLYDAPAAYYL